MSESGKPEDAEKSPQPDHWAELASELGAEPPEPPGPESPDAPAGDGLSAESFQEADSGRGAAAPGAAQLRPEVPKPFRAPREPRPPTDWDLLAEELGIVEPSTAEPADRPSVVEPSEPSVAPEGDLAKPDQGPEPAAAQAEAVFAEDEAEAAAARFEEAVDLFDDTAEPEPAASASPSAGQSSDGPDSGVAEGDSTDAETASAEAAAPDAVPFEAEAVSVVPPEPGETESDASDAAKHAGPEAQAKADDAPAAASTPEEVPGKRGKRRRRRPGRKKKGPAASAADQGQPQEEEKAAAAAGASEAAKAPARPGPRPAPEQPADAAASSQKAAKSGKVSHRGIPTWEQAIGLLITKNLEARPKPKRANGPSRGRNGGRGSGRRKR